MATTYDYNFSTKIRKIKEYKQKVKLLQSSIYDQSKSFIPIFNQWANATPEVRSLHDGYASFKEFMPGAEWDIFRYFFTLRYIGKSKRIDGKVVRVYILKH